MPIAFLNDPVRQHALAHLRKQMMLSNPQECMLCQSPFDSNADLRFCPCCAMVFQFLSRFKNNSVVFVLNLITRTNCSDIFYVHLFGCRLAQYTSAHLLTAILSQTHTLTLSLTHNFQVSCASCVSKRVFEVVSRQMVSVCVHCFRESSRVRHPPKVCTD